MIGLMSFMHTSISLINRKTNVNLFKISFVGGLNEISPPESDMVGYGGRVCHWVGADDVSRAFVFLVSFRGEISGKASETLKIKEMST